MHLAPGTYRRTCTFELDERDSNTTYAAAGTEVTTPGTRAVRLVGGRELPFAAAAPVTDAGTLERVVVEGRFGLGGERPRRTFRELGEQLRVSKERARQIYLRALNKLRVEARRVGLDDLT